MAQSIALHFPMSPVFSWVPLLADVILVYFLLKGKVWAKIGIIVKTILWQICFFPGYIIAKYTGGIFEFILLCCVLLFLFSKGQWSKLKVGTIGVIYGVCFICLVVFIGYKHNQINSYKTIIDKAPLLKEQMSNKGFKVLIPSNNWKFIEKDQALKFFREFAKSGDMFVIDSKGDLGVIFIGENIAKLDALSIKAIEKYFKESFFQNIEIINEKSSENDLFIEGRGHGEYKSYIYVAAFRMFSNIAVTAYFVGDYSRYV